MTNVFKMRELVAGPRKIRQEGHAVKDPKTGETVVSSEEIKRVNLEHCVNFLKNHIPKDEVKELLKFECGLHDLMMKDESDPPHKFKLHMCECHNTINIFTAL